MGDTHILKIYRGYTGVDFVYQLLCAVSIYPLLLLQLITITFTRVILPKRCDTLMYSVHMYTHLYSHMWYACIYNVYISSRVYAVMKDMAVAVYPDVTHYNLYICNC